MTIKTITIAVLEALLTSTLSLSPVLAANTADQTEPYIQGFPQAIPSRCDDDEGSVTTVWIGRFSGHDSGDNFFGQKRANRTVCFTRRATCRRWLNAMNREFSVNQWISECQKR